MKYLEDIEKYRITNKLKSIYRFAKTGSIKENTIRNESTAEHTWACIILADFILSKFNYELDKLKVYELLMYHDLVEINSGDYPIHLQTENVKVEKKEKEKWSANKLKKELPTSINQKFYDLFYEFEECKTIESKFANIIDKLEGTIQEFDYKEDWKGWTKEFTLSKAREYFGEFKEIDEMFIEIVDFLDKEGYFEEK